MTGQSVTKRVCEESFDGLDIDSVIWNGEIVQDEGGIEIFGIDNSFEALFGGDPDRWCWKGQIVLTSSGGKAVGDVHSTGDLSTNAWNQSTRWGQNCSEPYFGDKEPPEHGNIFKGPYKIHRTVLIARKDRQVILQSDSVQFIDGCPV